ncbi:MAG: SPASM domain-containing protein, partial [Dehalococcoidales bacterium]|nr:SPASM domain-containing protein [Dehalococcoidales bacterium]
SILKGIAEFYPVPSVFIGGFGEPLMHPGIVDMVEKLHALNARVEIITNGTLLTKEMSEALIQAGISTLWVSIDGARPESYADIRLGAELDNVIRNITYFSNYFHHHGLTRIQLGIVFVMMRRNIADLPQIRDLAWKVGASHLLLTNVLPYTPEMRHEALYYNSLNETCAPEPDYNLPLVMPFLSYADDITDGMVPQSTLRTSLPRIDLNNFTAHHLSSLMRPGVNLYYGDNNFRSLNNRCPFIERGSTAVSWDGYISPCLPLMHDYIHYLDKWERFSKSWKIGNVAKRSIRELWYEPDYIEFRKRVQRFEFSPCTLCGGCELLNSNEEDASATNFLPVVGVCGHRDLSSAHDKFSAFAGVKK